MSKFKVGDRVVTTRENPSLYGKGAEGGVVSVERGMAAITFTSGAFHASRQHDFGFIWLSEDSLELAKPRYSASFTQQTSGVGFGDFLAAGHEDNGSGLQKHSIGDYYPWLVVGYGHGEHHVFCIQNLETGATLGDFGGGDMNYTVWQWSRYYGAEAYLKNYLHGTNPFSVAARPIYGKPEFIDGVLQIKA